MKKLILIPAIALMALFYNTANAQIRIHLGISLPRFYVRPAAVVVQPAPVVYNDAVAYNDNADANYDAADDYYYLPDVNAYYDVADQCYYYNDGDNWVSAAYLPGMYRNYDWRNARRFEIHAPRPYLHNDFYRNRYRGTNANFARVDGGYINNDHMDAYRNQHFDDRNQRNVAQNYNRGEQFNQNRDQRQRFEQNGSGYANHQSGRRML